MHFCERCRAQNEWPVSIETSRSTCEMCGDEAKCYNVPAHYLYVNGAPVSGSGKGEPPKPGGRG